METQHLKISELFSFFIDLSSYSSSCQRRRRRLDGVLRGEGGVWSSVSPRRIINLIWCLDLRGCDSLQMWLIEKPDYVSALCHSADLWPLQAAAGFQSVKILLMSSALPGLLMTVNGFYTVRSAMRRCSDNQTQCKTQNLPTQPQQRTTAQTLEVTRTRKMDHHTLQHVSSYLTKYWINIDIQCVLTCTLCYHRKGGAAVKQLNAVQVTTWVWFLVLRPFCDDFKIPTWVCLQHKNICCFTMNISPETWCSNIPLRW